jgi:hypothetical protein
MLVDGREVDRVVEGTSYSRLETMCQMGMRAAPREPTQMAAEPAAQAIPPQNPAPTESSQPPQPAPFVPAGRAEPGPISPPAELPKSRDTVSDADLIAASVRLRVEDPDGRSCGSGTIIDNRNGQALVLTCGHLFRDSHGKGSISVDLFNSGTPQTVAGELISYDLSRDVGLVAIRCPGPVVIARLAPPEYRVEPGMPVVSVGCNNGDLPTARLSTVTRLNRFKGPPNIEVAGQPVEGRSGGGLFSPEGYVIGICNAADPDYQEGYFGAAASVYAELDRGKMAFVYQSPAGKAIGPPKTPQFPAVANDGQSAVPGLAAAAADMASGLRDMPPEFGRPLPLSDASPGRHPAAEPPRQQDFNQAEIICVIRPLNDPGAKSEIIRLDQVSAEFREQLAAEKRRQEDRQAKQLAESRPRRKLLEWSAADGPVADMPGQGASQLTRTSLEQRNLATGGHP